MWLWIFQSTARTVNYQRDHNFALRDIPTFQLMRREKIAKPKVSGPGANVMGYMNEFGSELAKLYILRNPNRWGDALY